MKRLPSLSALTDKEPPVLATTATSVVFSSTITITGWVPTLAPLTDMVGAKPAGPPSCVDPSPPPQEATKAVLKTRSKLRTMLILRIFKNNVASVEGF